MLIVNEFEKEINKIIKNGEQIFIDLVGINASVEGIKTKIYCFENHRLYNAKISDYSKKIISDFEEFIPHCNSEVVESFDENECFEMRIDIRNSVQLDKYLKYISNLFKFDDCAFNEIYRLANMKSSVSTNNMIPSLYFMGYKRVKGDIVCFKNFFRTVKENNEENSDIYDNNYYIEYLLKSEIKELSDLSIISEKIVATGLGNIHCMGIDCFVSGGVKYKVYFKNSAFSVNGIKKIIDKYMGERSKCLLENVIYIEKYMSRYSKLFLDFFCISVTSENEMALNLYYCFPKNTKQKYYSLRENLVVRDIGGLYFIVDICDKNCYKLKELYSTNEIGKVIFNIMNAYRVVTVEKILNELKKILTDYDSSMDSMIRNDIQNFLKSLLRIGYLKRY